MVIFSKDNLVTPHRQVRWNRGVEGAGGGGGAGATNCQTFEVSPDGQLIAVRGRGGAVHLLSGRYRKQSPYF